LANSKVIYFIKLARFSNTNMHVEQQLRRVFPEASLELIDVANFFKRPSLVLAAAILMALPRLGWDFARGRVAFRALSLTLLQMVLRNPAVFQVLGSHAKAIMRNDRRQIWFTFQTQGLWDNTLDGVPNFMYTDSAAKTNLLYKVIDDRLLPPKKWLELEANLNSKADRIFVMSNHVRQSFIEQYGVEPERVRRVLVGANVASNIEALQPAPVANKTILFVGVQWEYKGGPELVEAFRRLPERHRDARLVIVGVTPEIDDERCEIIGRVSASEVSRHYRSAAIFCLPTKIDPFGIVFIEAMMHKVAVVAPRHGALIDFISEKDTGLLFSPGSVDEIVQQLTWLFDHPDERQAIAERGCQAVRDTYNWDVVGDRFRSEILEVLGSIDVVEDRQSATSKLG